MAKNLKDNSQIKPEERLLYEEIINEVLDRDLAELDQDKFIIFPPTVADSEDLDEKNCIFESKKGAIYTGNIVGVLHKGHEKLQINSRFYESKDNGDYFIQYLLQKVLNYNVIKSQTPSASAENYYDLLAYLFPVYLEKAMVKGLYKAYIDKNYNDSNIKGRVAVRRHLKLNVPFAGKVAYQTREFSYDNQVTQLIRHTIEKLQTEYEFDFSDYAEIREHIRTIRNETCSYSCGELPKVLQANIQKPVKHGYFEEYYELQKLCIQILKNEKIGFGEDDEEVHGIIMDVAWLWEEYLHQLLAADFIHAENKKRTHGLTLFKGRKAKVYPDFYSQNRQIILDAKYKQLDQGNALGRPDLYQMISYLHVLEAQKVGVIYPTKNADTVGKTLGELKGYGGRLFKQPVIIPQAADNYQQFTDKIATNEAIFLKSLKQQCE